MKCLVDTCGWIEWLTEGKLAQSFEPYLKDPEKLIVPSIVQYELYRWLYRTHGEVKACEVIAVTEQGHVVPLDTSVALSAASVSSEFKLAMADAIVFATALKHQVSVVTCDAHFQSLPHVKYLKKSLS